MTTAQSLHLNPYSTSQEEIDNCSLGSDYLLQEYHTGNPAITYAYGAKTDTLDANVPRTYNQAMKSVEKEFWEKAIAAEIQSMITHDVWQETIIPRPAKPITTKWIFRPKCDINGNILSNTKLVSLLAVLNKFTAETSMKPTVLYFVYFLHSQASFHWYCFKWMWKRPF